MINVPTAHLKAALLAAGKRDLRYYLNGVHIETGPIETRVVATDGHIACVIRSAPCGHHAVLTVPRDVIETAVKMKRETTTFDNSGERARWIMNGMHSFDTLDDKFPPYRFLFKHAVSGLPIALNPERFALFAKMAAALGRRAYHVSTHYDGPDGNAFIAIKDYPDFAGVIMDIRREPGQHGALAPISTWVNE